MLAPIVPRFSSQPARPSTQTTLNRFTRGESGSAGSSHTPAFESRDLPFIPHHRSQPRLLEIFDAPEYQFHARLS